jgi:hypothetical protein
MFIPYALSLQELCPFQLANSHIALTNYPIKNPSGELKGLLKGLGHFRSKNFTKPDMIIPLSYRYCKTKINIIF